MNGSDGRPGAEDEGPSKDLASFGEQDQLVSRTGDHRDHRPTDAAVALRNPSPTHPAISRVDYADHLLMHQVREQRPVRAASWGCQRTCQRQNP
jgi:hypothetical protein